MIVSVQHSNTLAYFETIMTQDEIIQKLKDDEVLIFSTYDSDNGHPIDIAIPGWKITAIAFDLSQEDYDLRKEAYLERTKAIKDHFLAHKNGEIGFNGLEPEKEIVIGGYA